MNKQLNLFEAGVAPSLAVDHIFSKFDAQQLLICKEHRRIEKKPVGIHVREMCEYLSMWANTPPDGGIMAIGIEKDGTLSGCASSIERVNKLETAGRDCCPDARIEIRHVEFTNSKNATDFLLVVRVGYRTDRLVKTGNGNAFIRRGESKHQLSADEIRELESDKGQLPFELESSGLKYPEKFDLDSIRQWSTKVIAANHWAAGTSPEQAMVSLKLGSWNGSGSFLPNMACALLFSKDSRDVIPGCKLHFLRFEGEAEGTGENYNPVQDRFIHGTIPQIIAATESTLEQQLRTFTRLRPNGKFYSDPEYPKLAWYEAIVNACAHRSYGLRNMNIFVKMFEDRLEIESPGPFPPLVTPANIYRSQHPRNPNLMEALWHFDLVRCNNEGTKRMRDAMATVNCPEPEFRENDDGHYTTVKVTLRNNYRQRKIFKDERAAAMIGAAVFASLTENERLAINYATEKGRIKTSDLQRLTGLNWPQAHDVLLALADRGILSHFRKEGVERDTGAHFVLRGSDPTA